MSIPSILPSVETIPDDIDLQFRQILHHNPKLVTEQWLCELIQNSSHLTTPEYLRWRVVALLWLAAEFDLEKAWPYLMWFNMGEATVADHLSDIISDGADDLQCHVQIANWIAQATNERLVTFFSTYQPIPSAYKMAGILQALVDKAQAPEIGVWLAQFCQNTKESPSTLMRRWHLLAATWYATCFNATEGLAYLQAKSEGQASLSTADNEQLTEAVREIRAIPQVVQWIADCPDPAVKTMLQEFGHPNLPALVKTIFENPPQYDHLANYPVPIATTVKSFRRNQELLNQASIDPKQCTILDLACGPLATQTLLLNSAGYRITGVDLEIPPDYLPLFSIKQRLQKRRYTKAWKTVTAPYYQALADAVVGMKLSWRKVKIELADLTRLPFAEAEFDVILCNHYLQHAPDVAGLLAEACRVLKPDGLLIADIVPYASLFGGFDGKISPWAHLRGQAEPRPPNLTLNKWREAQYRRVIEKYFTLQAWQTKPDETAMAQLTPDSRKALNDYSQAELTQGEIVVVARKA